MLTVYHLERSQSERIVFLCEELSIPYELKIYSRDPHTGLGHPIFKQLHPAGTAPVITDGPITIAESAACIEYICRIYGGDRLLIPPTSPLYADFLQMFHWSNATLHAAASRVMWMTFALDPETFAANPVCGALKGRYAGILGFLEERLGTQEYLVGEELTAADIMAVYTLTTNRGFSPMDLTGKENILKYLQRLAKRPGYLRARAKADPETPPLLGPKVEKFMIPGLTGPKV